MLCLFLSKIYFWYFSGDDLASSANGMAMANIFPNEETISSTRFLMIALLDHLCSIYEKNPHKKEKLFKCKTLLPDYH